MTSSSVKKIIIVGASSGIGKELALLYAIKGNRVGITGRRDEFLLALKQTYPANIETACFDVMGNDNIAHIKSLMEKLGGLDLLIYNSGYGEVSKQLDISIEERTTRTNVNGFLEIVAFAFNYFVMQGYGQITGTSSIASMAGHGHAPAYSASKSFMSTYLEGLYLKAKHLKLPIAISDIQPGFVKTQMAKGKGRFWEAQPAKAASQIYTAIEAKRFRVYITKRWWWIAQLIKIIPGWLYRKIA